MNRAVYDTRFFIELLYSKDEKMLQKLKEKKRFREKYISTVVIHEIYKFSLAREGRDSATLKVTLIKKDFQTVPVDNQIAQVSAELRQKYNLSMADSMIAATASVLDAVCLSDDPHFGQVKEIKTVWI